MRTVALLLAVSLPLAAEDLLLNNGKFLTVDEEMSIAEAVLIREGRIEAVGTSDALVQRAFAEKIPILDLGGRTVVPGLVDAHVHALSAALSEHRAPLPPLRSYDDIRAFIERKTAETPPGEWIIVPRTFPTRLAELRMPTKELLDVATEHPVLFDASYVVVVNSYALEQAKISRYTVSPPGGEIVVDENGDPNGILKNAERLLRDLPPTGEDFTREEKLDALEQMLRRYVEAGLTVVGDRAVNREQIDLYRELRATDRLPLRVVLTWRPGVPARFSEFERRLETAGFQTGTGDRWLRFGPFKVTADGGMTIGTAYQRAPYGEFGKQLYGMTNPDDIGQRLVGPEKLLGAFRAARAAGWQLTAHAQGGGAIDLFLDVMEELHLDQSIQGERHHLMHASFQSPEAIQKMAALGVHADVQAPWLYFDSPALEMVMGWERMRYFFPLRTYIDNGILLAGGSDHMIGHDKNSAVNPYNPFLQMWMAITRARSQGEPLYPEEAVTREEALRMHTIWPAILQFAEEERGSIEPGKLADFVVLDRDYLTCPEDEIRLIEPVMTIIEGAIVAELQPLG